jgi:tRNA(Ile)-lysidine synthase
LHPRQPAKRINVARFTQTNRARKARLVSNGFWHIVSIVKEQDLPVMQKGYEQLNEYLKGWHDCQPLIKDFHTDAQAAGKSMRGGRIRGRAKKLSQRFFTMKKNRNAKNEDRGGSRDLARSVFAALEQLGVWRSGLKIGVAVSGGADSVALLRMMMDVRDAYRADAPMEIAVVHFNHQLRGRAADADERFVRKLADMHGLAFHLGSADVGAAAKRAKRNVEDAGRRERYAFFARLVKEGRVDCVATAHTTDDQAETVLAHILRGTGLAGLGGIHPVSGAVVRPLLGIRRAELRRYLKLRKQNWREDATNRDTAQTRARIRKKLIPLLEKQFQPEVVAHLASLAEHAREDEEFLNAAAATKLAGALHNGPAKDGRKDEVRIRADELAGRGAAMAVSGRMVRKIVKACKAREGEWGAQHVGSVLELARRGKNGTRLLLPGGVEVRREKETLSFRGTAGPRGTPEAAIEYAHEIAIGAGERSVSIPALMCAFRFRQIDWVRDRRETSETWSVADCARLEGPLALRNWRPGDRLQPAGSNRVHKLKRLLNEKGVSRWERNGWPVLTSGGEIIWARGLGVAAKYAANEETRTALLIDEEPF